MNLPRGWSKRDDTFRTRHDFHHTGYDDKLTRYFHRFLSAFFTVAPYSYCNFVADFLSFLCNLLLQQQIREQSLTNNIIMLINDSF